MLLVSFSAASERVSRDDAIFKVNETQATVKVGLTKRMPVFESGSMRSVNMTEKEQIVSLYGDDTPFGPIK